jgi:hypothetical protein
MQIRGFEIGLGFLGSRYYRPMFELTDAAFKFFQWSGVLSLILYGWVTVHSRVLLACGIVLGLLYTITLTLCCYRAAETTEAPGSWPSLWRSIFKFGMTALGFAGGILISLSIGRLIFALILATHR